ncbi:MAG: hypothetical protein FJW39_14480 [Acidobacteria bacterium]|nr:hypothetical protein [Acidobacteriota bacterium]
MLLRAALTALIVSAAAVAQSQDLNVLSGQVDGRELQQMLFRFLRAKAAAQLEARQRTVAGITNTSNLEARKKLVRERITTALGGFPERTPLNARVTGVIDRPDHRVEKVIFESQPGFYVTASLYLPKAGSGPFPAILFPLGHEAGAKAHSAWQSLLVTFARRGYVAFAWDTLGQGERIQLWDEDFRESKVIRSTTEHTILGLQTVLVGDGLARYTIWDGIRALDYLLSRPEVDKNRVGLTGNSGGGTHTAYIGALDDRIHVAAPSCYLTNWSRLLDTIGPQDAEQCMPPFLADGLDHPDFLIAFAPKPYMILSAVRDFFSIQGARSTYAEARRVYDSIGKAEQIGMTEADDGHGYTLPRREAAYRWFGKWLKGSEDTVPETPVDPATEEDLWCTPTGQVVSALGGETVFTLNQKRFAERQQPFSSVAEMRKFLRYSPWTAAPVVQRFGTISRGEFEIEKLTITPEPGITLPALLYRPRRSGMLPGIVLVSSQGKASANNDAASLAEAGNLVLSIDLRGWGELGAQSVRNGSDWPRYFGDFESSMTAMLTGKPLVSYRTEDLAAAVTVLEAQPGADGSRISMYGKENAGVPALYAAAFDNRVKSLVLEKTLVSFETVIRSKIHRLHWENAAHGMLRHYDLPKAASWLAPRPVRLIDPVNALGQTIPVAQAEQLYPGIKVVRRRSETAAALLRN